MFKSLKDVPEFNRYALRVSAKKTELSHFKHKEIEPIVRKLVKSTKRHLWENSIRWLVCNATHTLKLRGRHMSFSLHNDPYSKNEYGIGIRTLKALLSHLENEGMVNVWSGYVDDWGRSNRKKKGIKSIIQLNPELMSLWGNCDFGSFNRNGKEFTEIELRMRNDDMTCMPLRGHVGVAKFRDGVRQYNDMLDQANIQLRGIDLPTMQYRRIFNGSMNGGGRFYIDGGGIQILPQKYRREFITIDGERGVELDYSSIHPNLCYQMMKADGVDVGAFSSDCFNPYDVEVPEIVVDYNEAAEYAQEHGLKGYNPLRNLAKYAMLVGMNADCPRSADGAIGTELHADYFRSGLGRKYVGVQRPTKTGKLCARLVEHNYPIKDWLYTDKGVTLQNIDSKIASCVIDLMCSKGIPVLTYHDSFIVPESKKDVLKDAMFEGWDMIMKDTTFCKVDEK